MGLGWGSVSHHSVLQQCPFTDGKLRPGGQFQEVHSEATLVSNWLLWSLIARDPKTKKESKEEGRHAWCLPGGALSQTCRIEAGPLAGAAQAAGSTSLELSGPGAFVGSVTFCLQGPEQSVLMVKHLLDCHCNHTARDTWNYICIWEANFRERFSFIIMCNQPASVSWGFSFLPQLRGIFSLPAFPSSLGRDHQPLASRMLP